MHRLRSISYSDGKTPTAAFEYDLSSVWGLSIANPIGRLIMAHVPSLNIGAVRNYTPMGRVDAEWQSPPKKQPYSYVLYYDYDQLGQMLRATNGLGVELTHAYDGDLLRAVSSSYADPNHPATLVSGLTYNAAGQITNSLYGNGVREIRSYSPRQWLTELTATGPGNSTPYSLSLQYSPNGNVRSATDLVNGAWTYQYDDFNRLLSASGSLHGNYSWIYDRNGNRWQQNGAITKLLTFNNGKNRIDGYCYDAAGNLLREAACPADLNTVPYKYDAENRLISANGTTYIYDAEGRRVHKSSGADYHDYLYDLSGRVIADIDASGWRRGEIYAGSMHVATYANGSTYFAHTDWLGTERVRTGMSGVPCSHFTSLPFGDGAGFSEGCDYSPNKFTGKERDTETGLDYFEARYYGSNMGRMLSPDPEQASGFMYMDDPQSWNGYAYARNNPLRIIDPDGRTYEYCVQDKDGKYTQCHTVSDEQQSKDAQVNTFKDGKIYDGDTQIGTYRQIDVDLNQNAQTILSHPTLQVTAATMTDARTYALWAGASATLGYGLYAAGAFEGGLTTLELGSQLGQRFIPSPGQVAQASRAMAQGGRKAVEKAIRTLERRIAEHEAKIKSATGHTSSMEKEIRNFKQLIEAYKQVLGN